MSQYQLAELIPSNVGGSYEVLKIVWNGVFLNKNKLA